MENDFFLDYMKNRQPVGFKKSLVVFDEATKGSDESSPHIVDMNWIENNLCWNIKRRLLMSRLRKFIKESQSLCIDVEAILMGGSFVSDKPNPKDIDFLLIYRATEGFRAENLKIHVLNRIPGLDWRFVPSDAGVLPLLKVAIYCHILYQGRKGDKGSLLVTV